MIFESKLINDKWSVPKPASFSGVFEDAAPSFSADGMRLYFMSKRPQASATKEEDTASIWKVEMTDDGDWMEPIILGYPKGHASGWWTPFLNNDGYFYFGSATLDKDLMRTKYEMGSFSKPERLSSIVNHPKAVDVEPAIAPDGSYMIFYSAGRPDQMGKGLIGIPTQDFPTSTGLMRPSWISTRISALRDRH